jgi:AcrR family transcriptional regulator
MDARDKIRTAALFLFTEGSFEKTSVATICREASVSNGSFFHAFANKEALGAHLFLSALANYHAAMIQAIEGEPDAMAGVAGLVEAHLEWVVAERRQARFLFEQARSQWLVDLRAGQAAENARFGRLLADWRAPLVASGALAPTPIEIFTAQVIGPAQIFCRAWLSGRSQGDPREMRADLVACAQRALVASMSGPGL